MIFLAQLFQPAGSMDKKTLCIKMLENVFTGEFDPAFFHHHKFLFKCLITLTEIYLTMDRANAIDKSFGVLQVALGQARNLWPGFHLKMLCHCIESSSMVCYGWR
jgi:hypothetical protein